jgi:hypothetical protein
MDKLVKLLIVSFFSLSIGVGCASQTKTVRTETTTYPSPAPSVVEQETTVTTTSTPETSGGVVSGTVNVVGEVLALPFRAVGTALSAIF